MSLKTLLDLSIVGRCGNYVEDEGSEQMDKERGKLLVTGKL